MEAICSSETSLTFHGLHSVMYIPDNRYTNLKSNIHFDFESEDECSMVLRNVGELPIYAASIPRWYFSLKDKIGRIRGPVTLFPRFPFLSLFLVFLSPSSFHRNRLQFIIQLLSYHSTWSSNWYSGNNPQKFRRQTTDITNLTPTRTHLLIVTLRKVSSVSSLFFLFFFSVSKFTFEPRYCPKATSKREVNSWDESPTGRDFVNRVTRYTTVHWLRSVFRFSSLLTQFYKQWSASRI
jgi:hypothetical protein